MTFTNPVIGYDSVRFKAKVFAAKDICGFFISRIM